MYANPGLLLLLTLRLWITNRKKTKRLEWKRLSENSKFESERKEKSEHWPPPYMTECGEVNVGWLRELGLKGLMRWDERAKKEQREGNEEGVKRDKGLFQVSADGGFLGFNPCRFWIGPFRSVQTNKEEWKRAYFYDNKNKNMIKRYFL